MLEEKMAKVVIEGQTVELDEDIAKDDESLRAALKVAWPDAANATFTRETRDGNLTVKVIKKAGTKGGGVVHAALFEAPERINPALVMQRRLAGLDAGETSSHLQILALRTEIERAVRDGRAEIEAVSSAKRVLLQAQPEAGNCVPLGF